METLFWFYLTGCSGRARCLAESMLDLAALPFLHVL